MKKSIHSLLSVCAFGLAAIAAQAQTGPKILIVDMAKIFDNHYDTLAEKAKLDDANAKAQQQLDQMNKEGNVLVAEYKDLDEQSKNTVATADAKAKAAADAQKKGQEIQAKMQDRDTFANNARATIQQRIQTFRGGLMESIGKVVVKVAARHSATLVIDKSGPSLLGVSTIVYFDPTYDITDEVMAEINKDRPAAAAPAPAPAAAAPSGSSVPKITVPGVTKPAK